jgi:hypothetical protein
MQQWLSPFLSCSLFRDSVTSSISILLKWFISISFNSGRSMDLENCPFCLNCLLLQYKCFEVFPNDLLDFFGIYCDFSFSTLILYILICFFLLFISLSKHLWNCLFFLKTNCLLHCALVFLFSISIISSLIFIIYSIY